MKLKNKKTGEIGYPYFQNWKEITCVIVDENAIQIAEYTSLAELNAEWEDYEESKEYWFISYDGDVDYDIDNGTDIDRGCKALGNYFETKEEAEKAVEKLKAWKRLRDKGFRFGKWDWDDTQGHYILEEINFVMDEYDGAEADLDLLFGGEE